MIQETLSDLSSLKEVVDQDRFYNRGFGAKEAAKKLTSTTHAVVLENSCAGAW